MRRVLPMLGLVLGLLAAPAMAEELDESTRASVRKLGYEGIEHYQRQEYEQALDKLERSYRVLRVPTLGLWSARALEQQGRWVAASERYFEVMRLPLPELEREVHEAAQADAKVEREALEPRIPRLTAQLPAGIEPGAITLSIDARTIATELIGEPIPLDPGERRVLVQRGGAEAAMTITLEPETSITRMLTVPPAPTPEPQPEPAPLPAPAPVVLPPPPPVTPAETSPGAMTIAGWSMVGVGGATFLAGLGMGIYMAAERAGLDCVDDICDPSDADEVDRLNDLRIPTTALLVGGGVVAAVGVTLVVLAPSPEHPSAELDVTGRAARFRLRF